MKLLLFLAQSSRALLLSAIATSVLTGLGNSMLVALINQSLDLQPSELGMRGLQFAALSLAILILRWVSQLQFVELSQRTLAQLREYVSRRIADASYRDIESRGSARLMAVLTEDIAEVSQFFVTLPRVVMQGTVVLGCLGYLAYLSWRVFLFALVMVVVGSLGHSLWGRRAQAFLERARAVEDDLFEHFRALFAGAKELKQNAARRGVFLSNVLVASTQAARRERTRGMRIWAGSTSWGAFLFFAVIGVVLFGVTALFDVDSRVRSGYALNFLYLILPLQTLLEALPAIGVARIAIERIAEVDTLQQIESIDAETLPAPFEKLRLRGVVHRYQRDSEDGVFELGPLDLELHAGELVFLVGSNGSGKTTLAKVLVGLYAPEIGELSLNGVPVSPRHREAYRQYFSTVFTDFHLFPSLLGLESQGLDQRAAELLSELDLAHKVQVRDGRLSTTSLSRGQQKRLALLVACLEDRPVYVFDEWAADQDPVYKDVFYRRLLPALKKCGKCVFVITHDDRYFPLCDRLLTLSDGRLATSTEHGRGAVLAHAPAPREVAELVRAHSAKA